VCHGKPRDGRRRGRRSLEGHPGAYLLTHLPRQTQPDAHGGADTQLPKETEVL